MKNDHAASSAPVLEIKNLTIAYQTQKGKIEAVHDVSLKVKAGETLGLVGESGCGKSTIAFGIVNFLGHNGKIVNGQVRFQGRDLVGRSQKELQKLRGDQIAMVFQDPMQALNPSLRLGEQLCEMLTVHHNIPGKDAWERSVQMLERVRVSDAKEIMNRYAHQVSGGQQQRVVIAMAMLNNPALLIMDEPTSALDVTVEAAVLDLLQELKDEFNTANIFITHNLGVIARISDILCVMYAGQIVEHGPVNEVFQRPSHPYTRGLLACVPRLGESKLDSPLEPIRGRVPIPGHRPRNGCIFAPRCDYVRAECKKSQPKMKKISPQHTVRCVLAENIGKRWQTSPRKQKAEPPLLEKDNKDNKTDCLLRLENIKIYYPHQSNSVASLFGLGEKKFVKAVDDVSVRLSKGRTLGLVGESGCGKSTLVRGLIGLEPLTEGNLQFLGLDIKEPVAGRDTKLIREMQMVFQNPDSTLNPSYIVGKQIARPLKRFKTVPASQVKSEVYRLLKSVRLSETHYDRLPRQLSGGEKQRVGIARALASRPDLIICDEPVSSLDVSVQAAVVNLLLEIQQTFGSSMIFIAHDLSIVRYFSDDIAVMYLGQIVEIGPAESIYAPPYHPYTEALLSAVPIPDPISDQRVLRLGGNVPSALNPPPGCRFHTRCPRRKQLMPENGQVCTYNLPPWRENGGGHRILCHIAMEELNKMEPVINN